MYHTQGTGWQAEEKIENVDDHAKLCSEAQLLRRERNVGNHLVLLGG